MCIRDRDKSDAPRFPGGGAGGPGGGVPGGPPRDLTLTVKQSSTELAVSQKAQRDGQDVVSEQKFSLDGKEDTNAMPMGRGGQFQFKSKSKWDKDTLVIEGGGTLSTPNGEREIKQKLEYSLSGDGKVLTVQRTRPGRDGEMQTLKQVFNKQ